MSQIKSTGKLGLGPRDPGSWFRVFFPRLPDSPLSLLGPNNAFPALSYQEYIRYTSPLISSPSRGN